MKKFSYSFLIFTLVCGLFLFSNDAQACAMCKETGNQAGGFSGRGLNFGILYLMVIPYIAFSILAYFWYRASKKQKEQQRKVLDALKGKA